MEGRDIDNREEERRYGRKRDIEQRGREEEWKEER